MTSSPFHRAPDRACSRRGVTIRDIVIGLVVLLVVGALLFPVLVKFNERGRRLQCEANLRNIGAAIDKFRSLSPRNAYPIGSSFSAGTQSAGISWWVDILPVAETEGPFNKWNRSAAHGGDFTVATTNANLEIADGYRTSLFFCPSSALPLFADPFRYMSEANVKALGSRTPVGIAVPMYVTVGGSAPDARNYDSLKDKSLPDGRNTRDYKFGILSSSGVFPPNSSIELAAIRDMKDRVILVGEQSDYVRDEKLDPPDLYDVRSAWPKGAFMGTTGNYRDIQLKKDGLDGEGMERVWNTTTVRYPLNYRDIKKKPGIMYEAPAPRAAKKDDPPPPRPKYNADTDGPAHNNPLISAHPGGVQVLMASGGTQFFNDALDLGLLLKMCTRDDGAETPLP